jgi:hypothetical protein
MSTYLFLMLCRCPHMHSISRISLETRGPCQPLRSCNLWRSVAQLYSILSRRRRRTQDAPPSYVQSEPNTLSTLFVIWEQELSIFYRLPTEGYTQGGKFTWGDAEIRNSKVQGTQDFRQVRAARCVIPFVLYGGLYSLGCRMRYFEGVPAPLYIREVRVIWI